MTEQKGYTNFHINEIPYQEISDPAVFFRTPLVSVQMITYNHEPYIAQAIEGVLIQDTEFPIELIIGENCSSDRTHEIVMDYQQRHPDIIRVLTSDHNVGAHKNARRTERACRGKYVALCDGDDYWHHPQKLQKQIDLMENDPACVMTHTQCYRLFMSSGKQKLKCCTSTVCIRRKELNEIGRHCPECMDESIPLGDTQRWLELSRKGRVGIIAVPMATYRILPESASHSRDTDKFLEFRLACQDIVFRYLRKYPCPETIASKLRLRWHNRIVELAFAANRMDLVRSEYEKAMGLSSSLPLESYLPYWAAKKVLPWSVAKGILYTRAQLRRCVRKARSIGTKILMTRGLQR